MKQITISPADLKLLIAAAHAGGAVARQYFRKTLVVTEKSTVADYQTKADVESEKTIIKKLRSHFPAYNIYGEESGMDDHGSDYTFVIDPLDGSHNFVLGIPVFATSIALLYKQRAIAGVIYQPMIDHTYHATRGGGAYCGRKQLTTNRVAELRRATVAIPQGYTVAKRGSWGTDILLALRRRGHMRTLFSWCPTFELCLLAEGKIEAVINIANDPYDYLAGRLIAKQAGAVITDYGRPTPLTVESNVFTAVANRPLARIINGLPAVRKLSDVR